MTLGDGPQDAAGLPIRTVAVIGAGTAGRSFSFAAAVAGFRVILEDVMPSNLRRAQDEYSRLPAGFAAGEVEFASSIESAVREADVVVDFVPDELESKLEIFCLVDRMAPPKTILLTPSDALCITDLASCTYRGDRCFAVRGALAAVASGGTVQLIHPAGCDAAALGAVAAFLRGVGATVAAIEDQDAPVLVRNQR